MSKKCIGCGASLQNENEDDLGYTKDLKNDFCLRCFKIQNYGEYTKVDFSNDDFINTLKKIGQKKDLVLLVVDLLCIPNNLKEIREYLKNNKVILVLNKKDILPSSIKDEKIINYFVNLDLSFTRIVLISAEKNYNFDTLLKFIEKEKTSKDVYVVGNTNAGKSTMISKLIDLYDVKMSKVTISPMPSTTLGDIVIDFKDYKLIDTPGLVDDGNILNYVEKKYIKTISPRKEIRPKTYRIKEGESLVVDNLFRIDYIKGLPNSFTFYVSNDLKIKKLYSKYNESLKDYNKRTITFDNHQDILINGLGFIKIIEKGTIDLYIDKNVNVTTRKSLI